MKGAVIGTYCSTRAVEALCVFQEPFDRLWSSGVSKVFKVAALLFVCLLSACVTRPTQISREAGALQNWQASGRIAVSGAEAGGSGSFTWSQRDEDTLVQLRGPVGIGSLELTVPANGPLRMRTGDGQEFVAEDATEELTARLGASVPTRHLRFWLLGVAAPGDHEWSNSDETATLRQEQWRIDYQRFAIAQGVRLPTRLQAVSGPAKVRIVIDRWRLE